MSKFLGSIELHDNQALNQIAERIGLDYLDSDEVWREAEDYYEQNDSSEAEVRLSGLDYVIVWS